ncbi:hypothetical protein [Caballeronia sp. SBC2]|uniref:hypothetical protein n=1 Tax=Caballeronia sp. SBC2 TaxID=2705547 RepID=UPI0013E167F7|nr:hypothetical protein [Caballeronia sp. SBC2]QIE30348.1 hypothetical protein SBC2_84250 [Caballeronia sp. SBC2]
MPETASPLYPRVTAHSIRLASVYFPILVERAKCQHLITYGELVAMAKALHPDRSEVQNAIPVSSGRKLDVIRTFCLAHGLPDLASLVVNQASAKPGESYVGRHDADALQQKVFAFDWHGEAVPFEAHIGEEIRRAAPLVERTQDVAASLLFEYYAANRAQLPANIVQHKDAIRALLIEGHDVADAFELASKA